MMKILNFRLELFMVALLCFYLAFVKIEAKAKQSKKTYIIHIDKSNMPENFDDHLQWYDSTLKTVSESADMLYTYSNAIHGFSATLTPEEAESLGKKKGVLSVLPDKIYELHTTRSPKFLGLVEDEAIVPAANSESEVVVGVIDTGAWSDSKSFDDTGLGPIPSTWKGQCETGKNFNSSSCNRKLIGARFFYKSYEEEYGPINESKESKSPNDDDGHGTHTSTTIAGSPVPGASLFGFANGTARGMATQVRIAIYKVCWQGGCFGSDVLAAMDAAIKDGVNVISMSLGGGPKAYYEDIIALGAFSATSQGILVSCSAGNSGSYQGSVTNGAPWITTVGAGTIDRNFPAYVTLGNGRNFTGSAVYSGDEMSAYAPLVYAGDISNSSTCCQPDNLIPEKVVGKIVICDTGRCRGAEKGLLVKNAGGAGMILAYPDGTKGVEQIIQAHFLPSAQVDKTTADIIKCYAFSEPNATAIIASGGTLLGVKPSPVVAYFSSRGPNTITPELLKPDIIAPGVNIIAGWTGASGPTGLEEDTRRVNFNIISGTSMSCPHISGLAAVLKSAHPDWTPAAIRSALMTTAYPKYENGGIILDMSTGKPATPFDYGAGHVNPVASLDPGLVYDTTVEDYVGFLCASNYSASQIKIITKRDIITCNTKYSLRDFNYPSFSVPFVTAASSKGGVSGVKSTVKYTRTLTNVGDAGTYKVSLSSQTSLVKIVVKPGLLSFGKKNEKKSYTVTFTATDMPSGTTSYAHLEWSDGTHVVRSPIAFSWTENQEELDA